MNAATEPIDAQAALKEFLELTKAGKLRGDQVARVINDHSISAEEFFSVIPRPVAEIALVLRTPLAFEAFRSQAPTEAKALLEEAKAAAKNNLVGIEEHPVLTKVIQERLKMLSSKRGSPGKPDILTELDNIDATPLWIETKTGIAPAVAVTFWGSNSKALLRGTFDLDDLSFLAAGCVQLLKAELKLATNRMDAAQIPFSVLSERIAEVSSSVQEMKESLEALRQRAAEAQKHK